MLRTRAILIVATAVALGSSIAVAQNPALQTLRVISLPSQPLPITVAQAHGIFARYGLDVRTETAPNSVVLREALASGKVDVAHAAADNAVAMVDLDHHDVVLVIGGEGSLNELIAQPDIHAITDLRHRVAIVDAPNTAFALQLKKILLSKGLRAGTDYELRPVGATPLRLLAMREHKEYAASMLGPPTSLLAKREGFISLASVQESIGAYQGASGFVRHDWAKQHSDILIRYLAACIEAQRWLLAPENKQEVIQLMVKGSHLAADVAAQNYAALIGHPGGYEPDARFDQKGFENVLKIRAEVEGQPGAPSPDPQKYIDLSYFEAALLKANASR